MPQVSTALQFSRNYALPLDAMSVFANTAALEEAKSSPIAYAGMVATISGVEGNGKIWVLDSTKSNWLSVSGSSTGSTSTNTLGTIVTGTWANSNIPLSYGGTNAANSTAARTNLGIAIGSNVQAYSAVLGSVALATYTGSANTTTLGTIATGTWLGGTIGVAYGGSGATDATAARTNLGVRIGTNVQAYSAVLGSLAGGTYSGSNNTSTLGTISAGTWNGVNLAILKGGTGATDVATARTNLGVRIGTDVQLYHAILGSVSGATYTGSTSTTTLGTITTGVWSQSLDISKGGLTNFGIWDVTQIVNFTNDPSGSARETLNLIIGANVQAYSAVLGSVANATYSGSANTTTLGTITSGTWGSSNIAIAYGGTGATDATSARTNLGVKIGTDVQAYSALLGSIANDTYPGTTNTTTVGTINSGEWTGSTVDLAYGGTGQTTAILARTALGIRINTDVHPYNPLLGSIGNDIYSGSTATNVLGTITSGVWGSGNIAIAYGGTGATDATSARTNLGVRIGTDVQEYSATLGSVANATYTGSTSTTTVGTINSGTWSGANIAISKGGTNASNIISARTNLGLAIGTSIQAYSALLGSVASGTYTGSTNTTTVGTITAGIWNGTSTLPVTGGGTGATGAGADFDVEARTNLGVRIGTDVQSYSAVLGSVVNTTYSGSTSTTILGTINTGTWSGSNITISKGGTNASDTSTARTNLGIAIGTDIQAYSAVLGSVDLGTYSGSSNTTTLGTITTGVWQSPWSPNPTLNGAIPLSKGGTGTFNALNARGVLGITIGSDVQAHSSNLAAVSLGTYAGSVNTTTIGTITTGTWNGTSIAVLRGGTGATDAPTARTNLGIAIGTNVQAYSANLAAIVLGTYAGSANTTTVGIIATGTWNGTNIAINKSGTGATDATTARTNLGIAIGTNIQAYSAVLGSVSNTTYAGSTSTTILGTINSGTWNGSNISISKGGTNASNITAARTNLGLAIGTNVQAYNAIFGSVINGTYTGAGLATEINTVTTGTWNGSTISIEYGGTGANTATAAGSNLELGNLSIQNSTSVNIFGGNIDKTTIGNTTPQVGKFSTLYVDQIQLDSNTISSSSNLIYLESGNNVAITAGKALQVYQMIKRVDKNIKFTERSRFYLPDLGVELKLSCVAWNGSNLFVGTYNNKAIGENDSNVALYEVTGANGNNVWATNVVVSSENVNVSAAFGSVSCPSQRGYTGLYINGSNLFASFSTATGTSVINYNQNGITAFDISNRSLLWNYFANGSAGVSYDPGYGSIGQGVAWMMVGSGRKWSLTESTGTPIYSTIIDTTSTLWRDIDFNPKNGDVFLRRYNGITRAARSGPNSVRHVDNIVDLDYDAIGQNICYINGINGFRDEDLIVYNDRANLSSVLYDFTDYVKTVSPYQNNLFTTSWEFLDSNTFPQGNRFYDFSWDQNTQSLAISDYRNNMVSIFKVEAQSGTNISPISVTSSNSTPVTISGLLSTSGGGLGGTMGSIVKYGSYSQGGNVITLSSSFRWTGQLTTSAPYAIIDSTTGENTSSILIGSEVIIIGRNQKSPYALGTRVIGINSISNTITVDTNAIRSSATETSIYNYQGHSAIFFRYNIQYLHIEDNKIGLPYKGQLRIKPDSYSSSSEYDTFILQTNTTSNQTKMLTVDGLEANGSQVIFKNLGNTNAIIIPEQTTWNFLAKISAYCTTSSVGNNNKCAGFNLRGICVNDDFNETRIVPSNISEIWQESGLENTSVELVANNDAFEIWVTGVSDSNISWSCVLETCQSQYLDATSSGGGTGGGGA